MGISCTFVRRAAEIFRENEKSSAPETAVHREKAFRETIPTSEFMIYSVVDISFLIFVAAVRGGGYSV